MSVVLAIPLLLFAIEPLIGVPLVSERERAYVELALATPIATWAAWPFARRFLISLRDRTPNMWTLIGLGVIVAFSFSVATTLIPDAFPVAYRNHRYFDMVAAIVTLVLLGEVLERRARARTGRALEALRRLAPATARRIEPDGQEEIVPLAGVHVGDLLRVEAGEAVPVDGTIEEGDAAIDESMLTGESMPGDKGPKAIVVGATTVASGSFTMRASAVGDATTLAQIIGLVARAQRSHAPIEKLADRVAGKFVLVVLGLALVTFVGWAIAGELDHALLSALAVVIIACPCALGIATPISIMVAVGRGARIGVLFRDAEALQCLRDVDTLFVDKTGTLTVGRPEVVEVVAHELPEDEVLRLSAAVERRSDHPLAMAIVNAAEDRALYIPPMRLFTAVAGNGVTALVEDRVVAVGNFPHMDRLDIDVAPLHHTAESLRSAGKTVMYVAIDGAVAGLLAVADPIKLSTRPALRDLAAAGVRVAMVTGDNRRTAHAVAGELGIVEVHSEVQPADKLRIIERAQAEGHVVAMAGDGTNDAPALAQADVGIAMRSGTEIAMQSAAVTLVRGDLRAIARAIRLGKLTMRNINENLVFAFAFNAIGIPLTALWHPSPALAALAMGLSSVAVIANALRLRAAPI